MNTILVTTSSFGTGKENPLQEIGNDSLEVVHNPFGRKLTEGEVEDLIERYQPVGMIAGVEPLTQRVLRSAKNLKVISRCGIGLDSVDLDVAKKLGIVVTNTPDAVTVPVAELTLALILILLRQLHLADASVRERKWVRPMGLLLNRKRIGIIGLGRIGTYLSRLLVPFECQLFGHDPYLDRHEYCSLLEMDELLAKSDIVTLHIPYSEENHHFISTEELSKMKEGAIIVNAARGGLVDERALFHALSSKKLWGAALDCYEEEPYKGDLATFENVVLSTHIGSYAKEGRIMMENDAVKNLINGLKDQGISIKLS